jgi:hypothetical protein
MQWMQGPINDQALFWCGVKVFWWKRFITLVQLFLASSIFLNLMTAERKKKFHAILVERKTMSSNVVVPPVIRFRTLLKWFVPSVLTLAAGLAFVMHLSVAHGGSRQPIPFLAAWLVWTCLLTVIAVPMTQIIVTISMLRTGIRGLQRYAPRMLEWLLHYERFDRNVTVAVFVVLALVTLLQIYLS